MIHRGHQREGAASKRRAASRRPSSATRAVAFTHLPVPDESIFTGETDLRAWVEAQWGEGLRAFARTRSLKLVYLFFSNAYTKLLSQAPDRIISAQNEVRLREALDSYLGSLKSRDKKFVFVGLSELVPLLDPMDSLAHNSNRQDLKNLFLGMGQKLFYDCPKVIEALIRIARRHIDQSPILRFDEDVHVNEESVRVLIEAAEKEGRESRYFFFSGNYHYHSRAADPERYFLNDYSVRLHFLSTGAAGSLDDYIVEAGLDPKQGFAEQAAQIRQKLKGLENEPFHLDAELADRFLLDIVRYFGPDVLNQPISGAGLCISPLAIVQLPPFANVATNIMWIDDAMKHSLHIGLGDLDNECLRFVPEARFQQDRHPQGLFLKDVLWAYENYLPRLVTGCIMSKLMFDFEQPGGSGAFAESFKRYMGSRRIPTKTDRDRWADVAIAHLIALRGAILRHPLAARGPWRTLATWAERELDVNRPGCREIIDALVANPRSLDRDRQIWRLCRRHKLPDGRNAGAYVGQVISDLQRYIDLVDLWPHIVRTIDFLVRAAPEEHWLRDTRPL